VFSLNVVEYVRTGHGHQGQGSREGKSISSPSTCDYEERLLRRRTHPPRSFFRREGRPHRARAILTTRLIDRPMRPLFSLLATGRPPGGPPTMLSLDERVRPRLCFAVTGAPRSPPCLAKSLPTGPMAAVARRPALATTSCSIPALPRENRAAVKLDLVGPQPPSRGGDWLKAGATQLARTRRDRSDSTSATKPWAS